MWYNIYHSISEIDVNNEFVERSKIKKKKTGTPYEFRIEEYFTEDEIKSMEHEDLNENIEVEESVQLEVPY